MDDPLRPKTVPLSAETILWFEFLLDPNLLLLHLQKKDADPTPIELISQFLSISPDTSQIDITTPDIEAALNNEGLKFSRKQLALKILGLKVAAHLNWDLEVLEKNLPIQKQLQLLSDLCSITSGKFVKLPLSMVHDCQVGPDGSKRAFNFALTLYHRWVLRNQIFKELPGRIFRPNFGQTFLPQQDPANIFRVEMCVDLSEPFPQTSLDFLLAICTDDEPFIFLTIDSFVALDPTVEQTGQSFTNVEEITKAELKAQIYYDLCMFYFHVKKYDLACRKALESIENLMIATDGCAGRKLNFCTFKRTDIIGCLSAAGSVGKNRSGLFIRFNESILQQYKNIVEIFIEDNVKNEIPLVNRRIVELDIHGSILNGLIQLPDDLLVDVAALNTLKSINDSESLFCNVDFYQKYRNKNGLQSVIKAAEKTLPDLSLAHRNKIKQYFLEIILSDDIKTTEIDTINTLKLFTVEELNALQSEKRLQNEMPPLPEIAMMPDWKPVESKNVRLEIGTMKRQLISCTNVNTVRRLMVNLVRVIPNNQPLRVLNPSWNVPIPLNSVIMSMQRCFLQDFAFILIGKAKEMAAKNDFPGAISMLVVAKSETQRPDVTNVSAVTKLGKLIDWEILLTQICQTLEEWPKQVFDNVIMANKCKQCLASLQNGDNVKPRMDIMEHCAAMLLNLSEWSTVAMYDKRFQSLELSAAFANTILDMENSKGSKRICRDAWDLVLPMFNTNTTSKRGSREPSRDSPTLVVGSNLTPFTKRLRDVLIISIVLSLLARLHNILKDESNMELTAEYMYLWPTTVSNANAYSIRTVSETLSNLLKQALKYHPQHIPFIRLKGDMEFVYDNNEASMRWYVNALITGTEYCTLHLQRPLLDDYIVRRMIKCCLNLGCHIQAAILCQFLDEIDYVLAFKCISEKTTFKTLSERSATYSDAMDAYYSCIWDPTLLEFIVNFHSKKGEHKRKQQAIAILGELELNANNNEEIKREAASIRRTKFLRALAKQYML